jgi:hypothetical protein
MKKRRIAKAVVDAAKSLKPSEVKKDPAKAVGTVVGGVTAALGHPHLAPFAAKGAEKLADRAIPAARDRLQEFTEAHGFGPSAPQLPEEDPGLPPNPFKQ